jgi:hypothetical protein
MFRFPDGRSEIRYPWEQRYRVGDPFEHRGACYDVARVASEGNLAFVTLGRPTASPEVQADEDTRTRA